MKRILSFILVAILCLGVLTGCEQVGGIWDNVSGTVGGWLGLGGNETVGPTVDNAMTVLHNIMKEKNPITRDDYDVVAQVVAASDDGTKGTFKVTWTVDDDAIVIRESTKTGFYTVDLPDANAEEFTYTLTATISDDAGNKASKSYTFTFPVINNTGITSTPEEGVAYKIFLLQGSFQQRYYALATTQNNENKFINTDLDPAKAADFFVEKVDGGYKFYTNVDGVKTYVYAKTTKDESTGKISKYIGFSTEEGSVFSYNEAKGGVWTVKIDDLVYGVGTYGTYTTISLSDESYFTPEKVGDSQFVIKFITSEYANTLEPDKEPEKEDDAKAILEKLYGLADGESASGSFTLTGKITALDSYNNPTIVVAGYENMPVYCYKLADDRFEIGATITVTALSMKNYGGTYEFMSCTLDKFTAAGGSGSTEGGESYGVITELKTGDHVLIGNPSNGKLLSSTKTGFYNVGVDYSADNFANVTDAEIWVVTVNDDGSYSFTSLTGEKLGMAADYSSFNSEGPNFGWALEAKEGANGIFYIKNTVRGNYIEWYAEKGNWSSYATSSLSDLFELSFYKKGASGSDTPTGNEDAKKILDALYALQDNESLDGPFTLTGKIIALDEKKNPTIVVEGFENQPVYCYKLVVDNAVGDIITVTAKSMKNYKGTYEFMNCTLAHDCVYNEATCTTLPTCTICGTEKPGSTTLPHTWVDATCTVPKTCSVCKGTEGKPLAHTFVNGVCSCGVSESSKQLFVNMGEYATANGWTNGKMQNTVNANGDITFSVISTNPNVSYGNNTGKFYESDMTWRIYQADVPELTISGIEGVTIKFIQIGYIAKNEGTLAIGETFVENYALVAVNANSVTLSVINNGGGNYTNGQALITNIIVYYEGGNETPVQPEPPVHEHNFVEGKCECGEIDPDYVAPETPEQSSVGFTISANNSVGLVYFTGKVSSGRFTGSYNEADAVVVYLEKTETEGMFLLYFLDGETKTYIVMDDSSTGCKLTTTASEASVFEWNDTYKTYEVANDDNGRAFGFDPSKDFTTFSAYAISNGTKYNWGQFTEVKGSETPVDPQPPVHQHNFVEGKCECGETDPDYVPETPVEPEQPEQSSVGYTISANNSEGLVYFNGGVSSGRFTGSYNAEDAVVVYIEKTETDGEVLLYFFNGETKTYIVMGDKTTYCSTTTTVSDATPFEWNAEKNTYVVADDANNRAFGFDRTKNFTTFSAYDVSGDYNWGQFTAVA